MMNVYSLRRSFLFVVSLFINALGIDFITKALLGTSPITGVNSCIESVYAAHDGAMDDYCQYPVHAV